MTAQFPLPAKIRTRVMPAVELDHDPARADDDQYPEQKYWEVRTASARDGRAGTQAGPAPFRRIRSERWVVWLRRGRRWWFPVGWEFFGFEGIIHPGTPGAGARLAALEEDEHLAHVVAPLAVGDFLSAGSVDTALLGIDWPPHPKPVAGARPALSVFPAESFSLRERRGAGDAVRASFSTAKGRSRGSRGGGRAARGC